VFADVRFLHEGELKCESYNRSSCL